MSGLGPAAYRCLCPSVMGFSASVQSVTLESESRSSELSVVFAMIPAPVRECMLPPHACFGELIMMGKAGKEGKRRKGSRTSLRGPGSVSGTTRNVWSLVHVGHLRGSVLFHFHGSLFSGIGIALKLRFKPGLTFYCELTSLSGVRSL